MDRQVKYVLQESDLPRQWYNIVPDLPALADLPSGAVLRYDGSVPSLAAALSQATRAGQPVLAAMSAAATTYASAASWPEISATTLAEMASLLAAPATAPAEVLTS